MRRFVQRLLVLGLAALPYPAQAQYMAPNYYYYSQPTPAYNPYYPYGYQGAPASYPQQYQQAPQWGQPVYYYAPPADSAPASTPPAQSSSTSRYGSAASHATAPAVTPQPMPVAPTLPPAQANPEAPAPFVPPAGKGQPPTLPLNVTAPAAGGEATAPQDGDTPKPGTPEPIPAPKDEGKGADAGPVVAPALPALPGGCKNGKQPALPEAPPVPGAACPANGCAADKHQKFLLFGEFLYWNVHGANVPFAQAFDGVDPILSVPRGPVGVAAPNFTSGFRTGGGVALSDRSWLIGTYTYYRENSRNDLTAPDGTVLHAFLTFPNTVNSSGTSLTARTGYDIDLQTADVDYKCAFIDGDRLQLSWLAGARYGHLKQALLAEYDITGTTTVDSHITFNSGGPRAGLDGEYKVGMGAYGYGKGILNLLVGQFSGSYTERSVFTGLVGQTQFSEERLVPVLEFELGVGWQSPKGHLRMSAGYYVGAWFNTMTTQTLATSIQGQGGFNFNSNNFSNNTNNFHDTITFDGLVGRIEMRY